VGHRFWPKFIMALLVLAVFGALWLFDTGALLQITRFAVQDHPRTAFGICCSLIAIVALISHLQRPKPKPKRVRKPKNPRPAAK